MHPFRPSAASSPVLPEEVGASTQERERILHLADELHLAALPPARPDGRWLQARDADPLTPVAKPKSCAARCATYQDGGIVGQVQALVDCTPSPLSTTAAFEASKRARCL